MAKYTVRVELIGADSYSVYETLHEEMESRGFTKTIIDGKGEEYELPDAEYNIETTLDKSGVLEKAKSAASITRKKYRVLVTKSSGRTWYNLESV